MIVELTCFAVDRVDQQVIDKWRWQGRLIHVVDGSTLVMSDTAENQAVFPQQSVHKAGLGFSIGRLVGITYLSSGVLKQASKIP